uniref:Putative helicase MOV10L1 n=1 Tax=Tetraselmis sp. GSL018 TaxID=582737 RepID=A0A061SEU4_9CHLO|mmetsp:Transcript_7385/g.17740  ORF Transcript_7385/g.17740 Transcript_7385/m.17740 type:complete len:1207 (-) Transcript_7385:154-3774(-)|eukprot:CAMPEP_0177582616 /NCGR_PEP_ID=MMETSP0419_2-20121207/2857_1 /TAXON_ID=582737 /ORGANISM="Tetraselmis sp., Strain GSL018" /LENGTH=1206 /DNA_ID=CAMNT_0019071899 /DNA_START=111 /DNA_END=3731 /DNA_ORIENTATION=-
MSHSFPKTWTAAINSSSQLPHKTKDIVVLAQNVVNETISDYSLDLKQAALVIFLSNSSSDTSWFRNLKGEALKSEAIRTLELSASTEKELISVTHDVEAALKRLETCFRALLDHYFRGRHVPSPTVLYVAWTCNGSAPRQAESSGPIARLDLHSCIQSLLRLPGNGLRLFRAPPRLPESERARAPFHGAPARAVPMPVAVSALLGEADAAAEAALRNVRALMAPMPGVDLSPGADFGVWQWGALRRRLFRQVHLRNSGGCRLWVIGIRLWNPSKNGKAAFLLEDDFGLAAQHREGTAGSAEGVCLDPGASYAITIIMDPESEGNGLLLAAAVALLAWEGAKDIVCTGWRITAGLLPPLLAQELRPEAPQFVPQWQREFFDAPAGRSYFITECGLQAVLGFSALPACTGVADIFYTVLEQQRAGASMQRQAGQQFWASVQQAIEQLGPAGTSEPSAAERRSVLVGLARALAAEEATMDDDIRKYDRFGVRIGICQHSGSNKEYEILDGFGGSAAQAGGRLLWNGFLSTNVTRDKFLLVEVEGLPEGRPALEACNTVFLRVLGPLPLPTPPPPPHYFTEFACLVMATDGARVLLMPPEAWWQIYGHAVPSNVLIHMRLGFDWVVLRRMGKALVRAIQNSVQVLPPTISTQESSSLREWSVKKPGKETEQESSGAQSLDLVHKKLNKEQILTVLKIVNSRDQCKKFVIFGPAGTGKTLTLTEVIVQVLKASSGQNIRILACAPTAFAADILCAGLADAGLREGELINVNDPRRTPATVRPGVLRFCLQRKGSGPWSGRHPSFYLNRNVLGEAKVVVSSCSSAALLEQYAREIGGFDLVVIDEAAQALVAEALIPLSLRSESAAIVLAGDPRQLGPNARSQCSAAAPLLRQSLEQVWLSQTGVEAPEVCVLLRNYRSNAALLELPSHLFYDDLLISEADKEATRPPNWDEIAYPSGGKLPVETRHEMLFYGVMGQQVAADPLVPSWSNPVEALRCVELVEGLLRSAMSRASGNRQLLLEKDIGVMAPFRKQVYEIRKLLRQRRLGDVRCGTVDNFQGQEARVIFISTTLSQIASLQLEDSSYKGGSTVGTLLSDVRRFCVAITRAQSLLVVVGHPFLLLEANTWRKFILHCAARGAYKGARPEALASHSAEGMRENFQGETEEDFESAVEQIRQMAVLGAGNADSMFPDIESPECLAASYSEEIPWRVAL